MTNNAYRQNLMNQAAQKREHTLSLSRAIKQQEYNKQVLAQQKEQERLQREQEEKQRENDNKGFFQKLGETLLDTFILEPIEGIAKGIEGIADLGVTLAGGIGDLFGADTQWAEDIVKFDASKEWLGNNFDKVTGGSWINGTFVEDAISAVGTMLPAVGLAAITGGSSTVAMGAMIGGAVGSGTEEALNDGANFGQALAYGTTQGVIEGATEFVGGKVFGSSIKNMLKPVGKSAAKTIGKQMIGEAFEEGLGELVNPLARTTYKGGEALEQYKDPEFYKQVGKSALVGGLAGGVMQGGSVINANIRNNEIGGMKANNISENLQELETLKTKVDNLQKKLDNGTTKNVAKTEQQITDLTKAKENYYADISKNLQSMKEEQRTKAMAKFDLQERYNSDGTNLRDVQENAVEGKQGLYSVPITNEKGETKTFFKQNEQLKNGAMSMSLVGEKVRFAPTQNALTENSVKAKETIAKLSPSGKFVIADDIDGADMAYDPDTKITYISQNADPNKVIGKVAVHEITHSLEGTKQYASLQKFLQSDDGFKSFVASDLSRGEQSRYKRYVDNAKLSGESEGVQGYIANTEAVADYMGEVLMSDPASIQRLVNSQRSLASRIVEWIKNTIKTLVGKGDTKSETYKYLRNIEKLYADAMHSSVGGVSMNLVRESFNKDNDSKMLNNTEIRESKKLGGYNPEIIANTSGVREYFGIKSVLNKTEVVEKVAKKLSKTFLSTEKQEKFIKNIDTGIEITITKKGILETFWNEKYYGNYTYEMKLIKLASMEHLAKMIKYGEVRADDAKNYHKPNSPAIFSYLESPINIDGKNYNVTIDIKKTQNENKFYIHNLILKKVVTSQQLSSVANVESISSRKTANDYLIGRSQPYTTIIYNSTEKATQNAENSINNLDDDIRYSIKKDVRNREYVEIESDILKDVPKSQWKSIINSNLKTHEVQIANSVIKINYKTRNEISNSNYTQKLDNQTFADKVRATKEIDEVLKVTKDYINEGLKHKRKDTFIAFARGKTLLHILQQGYSADVIVGITSDDNLVLYDIVNFIDELIVPQSELKNKKARQEAINLRQAEPYTTSIYNSTEKATQNDENLRKSLKDNSGKVAELKTTIKDLKIKQAVENRILDTVRVAQDIKNRKYKVSAGVLSDPAINGFVDAIAGFHRAGSKELAENIRERVGALGKVYSKDNELLTDKESSLDESGLGQYLDPNITEAINFIADGKGKLDIEELKALKIITKGIMHLYRTYDTVFRNGKQESLTKIASHGVEVANRVSNMTKKDGFAMALRGTTKKFLKNALDPKVIFEGLDGYDSNGEITKVYYDIIDGDTKTQVANVELHEPIEQFYKEHKGYKQTLESKNSSLEVQLGSQTAKLTRGQAIALYMYSKREQANLYNSGIVLNEKNGFKTQYNVSEGDIETLKNQLTENDLEFIETMRKMFNEQARALKVETDEQVLGYSVTEDTDWYIPIRRDGGDVARNAGSEKGFINDIMQIDNMSFNKKTSKKAKLPITLNDITSIADNHIKGVSVYHGLALPIKNFNKIWNKKVLDFNGNKTSIKKIIENEVDGNTGNSEQYINKFLNDIQGVKRNFGTADRVFDTLRGNYAKFQLGLNLGTVLKQTASFATASIYLDPASLAKGLVMKSDTAEMFKYAPLSKARLNETTYVKAQTVYDNKAVTAVGKGIEKVGDITMKPIQWMDDSVIKKLWTASQVQTAKESGEEVGTIENKEKAGKLLEKVIRDTQSNSIMSERSQLSRSDNSIVRGLTMFTSDAQKQFSRIYEATAKIKSLQWRIKNETNLTTDQKTQLETELKSAKKLLMRTAAAITISMAIVSLITMMMNWLLKKKDKEEPSLKQFSDNFIGNVFGMLPLIRDAYGFLVNDYEVNNYAFGMINDSLSAIKGTWEYAEKLISGQPLDRNDTGKTIRDFLYAIGQATGMPVRNAYNLIYGVVDKFSPESAWQMNSLFYGTAGGKKEAQSAFDKGNEQQANSIMNILVNEKIGNAGDSVVDEISKLTLKGNDAIPKTSGESITYNGKKYELSGKQQKKFNEIYNGANTVIEKMLNSKEYKNLDDKAKAKAINAVYDYYYNLAVEDLLGVEIETKAQLFGTAIPPEKLYPIVAYCQSLESDKDKSGKTVSGSLKNKITKYIQSLSLTAVQKYMIMGYLGYSNDKGASSVKSFIQTLKLTKGEKEMLYGASGYTSTNKK